MKDGDGFDWHVGTYREYDVICENTPDAMHKTVGEYIDLGWKPLGGVAVIPPTEHTAFAMFQAIERESPAMFRIEDSGEERRLVWKQREGATRPIDPARSGAPERAEPGQITTENAAANEMGESDAAFGGRLLAAALIAGEARWEFYTGSGFNGPRRTGEICIGGLRHPTSLGLDGCPVITPAIFEALEKLDTGYVL